MNCLGLDFGLKHIGVAMATGPLAEPLTTLPAKSAVQLIKQLVNRHSIQSIIIGQPDKSLEFEFDKFVNSLKILNLKFEIVDESLSSHDARQALFHTSKKRRRVGEHSVSAAIILQSWLDSHPKTS